MMLSMWLRYGAGAAAEREARVKTVLTPRRVVASCPRRLRVQVTTGRDRRRAPQR